MNNKKKYYMRGLGFGILITAIILTIVHRNDAMTDEKAIKRAEELGYVYNGTPSQSINIDALKAKLTETPAADVPAEGIRTEDTSENADPTPTPGKLLYSTATPVPEEEPLPYGSVPEQ